ncbi:kinase A anchor protein [Cadophora sp. MPI-SDFR-AT-0126]|nr:kinase A anchor protein [Leotiomycetes sp. MPI-SDFR-AT-0126]
MPPRPSQPRLTHFLAIPLVTPSSSPQLQHSFALFRDKVTHPNIASLSDGVPEQAIRPLGTLHLTLGVMSLTTREKVEGVLELLRSLEFVGVRPMGARVEGAGDDVSPVPKLRQLSDTQSGGDDTSTVSNSESKEKEKQKERPPPPLHITLQGLQSMHDPSKTSVLYAAPLDPNLRLYRFCVKLREVFKEFLVGEQRPLLLHATVVNTVYVKGRGGGGGRGNERGGRGARGRGGGRGRERLTLDARELLRGWEDFVWMRNVRVESVAVLRMGAKVGESGEEEYEVEGEVDIPK